MNTLKQKYPNGKIPKNEISQNYTRQYLEHNAANSFSYTLITSNDLV